MVPGLHSVSARGAYHWPILLLRIRRRRGADGTLAELPGPVARAALVAAILLAALALRRLRRAAWKLTAALALGLSIGLLNAGWQAQTRLDDGLSEAHHDQVTRLMLQVTGLPDGDARRWRFVADTLEPAPPGIPSRLLVTWHASPDGPDLPALAPGRSGAWRWCCAARRDCATRACRMRKAGCSRWACGPPARCAASRSSWPTAPGPGPAW